VNGQVRLLVACDIQCVDTHGAGDRRLEDAGSNQAALVKYLARQTDVDGDDFHDDTRLFRRCPATESCKNEME
jgi:hypothetical protein